MKEVKQSRPKSETDVPHAGRKPGCDIERVKKKTEPDLPHAGWTAARLPPGGTLGSALNQSRPVGTHPPPPRMHLAQNASAHTGVLMCVLAACMMSWCSSFLMVLGWHGPLALGGCQSSVPGSPPGWASHKLRRWGCHDDWHSDGRRSSQFVCVWGTMGAAQFYADFAPAIVRKRRYIKVHISIITLFLHGRMKKSTWNIKLILLFLLNFKTTSYMTEKQSEA